MLWRVRFEDGLHAGGDLRFGGGSIALSRRFGSRLLLMGEVFICLAGYVLKLNVLFHLAAFPLQCLLDLFFAGHLR